LDPRLRRAPPPGVLQSAMHMRGNAEQDVAKNYEVAIHSPTCFFLRHVLLLSRRRWPRRPDSSQLDDERIRLFPSGVSIMDNGTSSKVSY